MTAIMKHFQLIFNSVRITFNSNMNLVYLLEVLLLLTPIFCYNGFEMRILDKFTTSIH